jgi:multiple sugar transport system permease protein
MATTTTSVAQVRKTAFLKTRQGEQVVHDVIIYVLLLLLSVVFAFPFFWMVSSSLKSNLDIFQWPPQWLPIPPVWDNYPRALGDPNLPFFPTFLFNTLTIVVLVLIGRMVSCVLVAYAFARLEAKGKEVLFALLLATLMIPGVVLLFPKYILFNQIGWVNTILPLVVPSFFAEAYAVFLMRQFFQSIPREIEEAARIDGCNTFQIITRMIVPLSLPVLTVISIFTIKDNWNDFFGPLLYLSSLKQYTMAIGLAFFNGQFRVEMGMLMAASVVVMLPLIVLFFIFQRAFVEGISLTGMGGR